MIGRFFRWLVRSTLLRLVLGVVAGWVAWIIQAALPDAGWVQRTGLVFVAMLVIGWAVKPLVMRNKVQGNKNG